MSFHDDMDHVASADDLRDLDAVHVVAEAYDEPDEPDDQDADDRDSRNVMIAA